MNPVQVFDHVMLGVPGTMKRRDVGYGTDNRTRGKTNAPGTWYEQTWESKPRKLAGKELVICSVRFDDQCFNGHNSFAITGHTYIPGRGDWETCGCIHETIAKVFPELEPLIQWHLFDADGPMHYVANTIYHASNLHNGKAKGEPCSWDTRVKFGVWPATMKLEKAFREWLFAAIDHRRDTPKSNPYRKAFEIVEVPHTKKSGDSYQFDPHYSFDDYTSDWYKAPFKTRQDAEEFKQCLAFANEDLRIVEVVTGLSPGKERDLDAARRTANWPEATDEQLCLPKAELKALLEARLPAMMQEFREAITGAGLEWEPPSNPSAGPSGPAQGEPDSPVEPPKPPQAEKPAPVQAEKPAGRLRENLRGLGVSIALALQEGDYFERGF